MVEESLKPNFSMPVWKYLVDKDSKWKQK
jgi:hypothetical protein